MRMKKKEANHSIRLFRILREKRRRKFQRIFVLSSINRIPYRTNFSLRHTAGVTKFSGEWIRHRSILSFKIPLIEERDFVQKMEKIEGSWEMADFVVECLWECEKKPENLIFEWKLDALISAGGKRVKSRYWKTSLIPWKYICSSFGDIRTLGGV